MSDAPLRLADLDPAARLTMGLAHPSAFYVTGEDALQLSGWNIATGVRLRVAGRLMGLDGVPRPFVHDLAMNTDRTIASVVRSLGEGWILDLTVSTGSTAVTFGQCFARVQVVRGVDSSGIVIGTLCAGYVTAVQPIAFPAGRVRGTLEGPGVIRSITGTDPAAGVEIRSEERRVGKECRL